jgi:hypothetical protein
MITRLIPMGMMAFGAIKGADKLKKFLGSTQEVSVQYEIGAIVNVLELDYLSLQSFPEPGEFSTFLKSSMKSKVKTRDTSKDQWGNSYTLELKDGTAIVRSAGPDKVSGSSDDIVGIAKP